MDDDEIPTLIQVPIEPSRRVPLTVICGFLGAGKSTLLRRILTERHGYRIAVIMNEFGDTADIEARTINVSSEEDPTAQSEEVLELANGCLCCSIKDTGVAAIEKLMQRKGAFDHILLETTGLADPGPIAAMFWHNEEFATGLGTDISLDGVICVVDAMFGMKQMQDDSTGDTIGESLRQIAGSDVIILNKIDLVSPPSLTELERTIKELNPAAPIHRTVQAQIDLKHIMGIGAYAKPPPLQSEHHDHEHSDDHDHPTHYEMRGISSLQIDCPVLDSTTLTALDKWLQVVLWESRLPEDSETAVQVLRCKGMFFTNTGEQYVLQGVRSMYELLKLEGQEVLGIPEMGKLVLIGKGLNDVVRHSLKNAVKA